MILTFVFIGVACSGVLAECKNRPENLATEAELVRLTREWADAIASIFAVPHQIRLDKWYRHAEKTSCVEALK